MVIWSGEKMEATILATPIDDADSFGTIYWLGIMSSTIFSGLAIIRYVLILSLVLGWSALQPGGTRGQHLSSWGDRTSQDEAEVSLR